MKIQEKKKLNESYRGLMKKSVKKVNSFNHNDDHIYNSPLPTM